ncbi:MAG: hypothetical protein ACOY4F_00110 [Thermodesulfobacteriota bacterium]
MELLQKSKQLKFTQGIYLNCYNRKSKSAEIRFVAVPSAWSGGGGSCWLEKLFPSAFLDVIHGAVAGSAASWGGRRANRWRDGVSEGTNQPEGAGESGTVPWGCGIAGETPAPEAMGSVRIAGRIGTLASGGNIHAVAQKS